MRRFLPMLAAATLHAAPAIVSAVNAASHLPAELPNSGIARGSLFTIEGLELGPSQPAHAEPPLSVSLGGTSVRVASGGASVDCWLTYAAAGQLTAILPSAAPVGEAKVVVTRDGESSPPFDILVVESAFGIFTRNQAGSGPAVAQNAEGGANLPFNALTQPARPGQTVTLWGTGLGPAARDEASGPLPGDLASSVEVFVGGLPAAVSYRGRSNCCAGVDHVSFAIPAGAVGCHVPVAIRSGGSVSNFATISIDETGRSCSDPNGASADDLDFLRASGSLAFGLVEATRLSFGAVFADFAEALFARGSVDGWTAAPSARSLPPGSCSVRWERNGSAAADARVDDGLDAGSSVSVTVGSNSRPLLARFGAPGLYTADLNRFLEPGPVTVDNAGGGAQVKGFRVTVNVPAGIQWTNADAVAVVARDRELTVTWTGGSAERETAVVYGVVPARGGITAGFSCAAPVADGRFTVPEWVVSALPPGASAGVLGVGVANSSAVRFNADGIRFGAAAASNLSARNATYR